MHEMGDVSGRIDERKRTGGEKDDGSDSEAGKKGRVENPFPTP